MTAGLAHLVSTGEHYGVDGVVHAYHALSLGRAVLTTEGHWGRIDPASLDQDLAHLVGARYLERNLKRDEIV